MRFTFLFTIALVAVFTTSASADVIFVDDFSTVETEGFTFVGDGAVSGNDSDRTVATDGSIMTVNNQVDAQDRELQSILTSNPTASAAIAAGVLSGTVQTGTAVTLTYDGRGGSDALGLSANGAIFDFLTQTGGNGQHSFFIEGSGADVRFDFIVRSATATGSVLSGTFDPSGTTQITFQSLVDGAPGLDLAAITSVDFAVTGTTGGSDTFTVGAIYAHNPEPASIALFCGLAIAGLVIRRRQS